MSNLNLSECESFLAPCLCPFVPAAMFNRAFNVSFITGLRMNNLIMLRLSDDG